MEKIYIPLANETGGVFLAKQKGKCFLCLEKNNENSMLEITEQLYIMLKVEFDTEDAKKLLIDMFS